MANTTYANLIQGVAALLHSQTLDQEEQTVITSAITAGATTFNVDDGSQVSRGLIEVDDELMWVKAVDQTNNTVTISPAGRGYRDTTAAAHNQYALVLNNPRYPRQSIRNAIQEVISALYPDLYSVKTDETQTSVSTTLTYQAPADVAHILRVQWQSVGPTKRWVPVRRWNYDPTADATAFTTGKSLDIYDPMTPGRTIKVTYAAQPSLFVNDTDTIESIGLAEDHRDILILGAASRLLMYQDAARLQVGAVEQSERSALVPPGAGGQAGRNLYQLYKQRVAEEAAMLQRLYPTTVHLTR